MLGKFTCEQQLHSSLNVLGGQSGLLGEEGQLSGLIHDSLKEVRHNLVALGHSFLGDSEFRLHLLHDSEDVELERLGVSELEVLLLLLGVLFPGGLLPIVLGFQEVLIQVLVIVDFRFLLSSYK